VSNHEMIEYDDQELRLLGMLPRESELQPGSEDRLVKSLRAEGFFVRRSRSRLLQAVAAIALLVLGGLAGAWWSQRNSLEALLQRPDLDALERVLLLQRAGSAYVQAADAYAASNARTNLVAIEVATQVLIGAAQAVERSRLDAGLTPKLTQLLQQPNQPTVIWF
jgi:hypothetical protein